MRINVTLTVKSQEPYDKELVKFMVDKFREIVEPLKNVETIEIVDYVLKVQY